MGAQHWARAAVVPNGGEGKATAAGDGAQRSRRPDAPRNSCVTVAARQLATRPRWSSNPWLTSWKGTAGRSSSAIRSR